MYLLDLFFLVTLSAGTSHVQLPVIVSAVFQSERSCEATREGFKTSRLPLPRTWQLQAARPCQALPVAKEVF